MYSTFLPTFYCFLSAVTSLMRLHCLLCVLQRTRHYENKLDELRHEVTQATLEASEAQVNKACYDEKEAALRTRLEKTAQELDALKVEGRAKTVKLQVSTKLVDVRV